MSIFVSASDLVHDIYHGHKQTVLASLWGPGEGEGKSIYQKGHLPTALFCDPAAALAGVPGSDVGRNPLPESHHLQSWFRKWGLAEGGRVIVYDEGRGILAGRAWWILRWAGVDNVEILDGGPPAWETLDLPVVGGPGNFAASSDAKVTEGQMPVATIEDAMEHSRNGGILVDTRERNRFAGRREILDLKAGHIPGAVNVPVRELQNDDYTMRSPEEIRAAFAEVGVTDGSDVIVYSGSGNHSALALAAMEVAGLTGAAHFLGGWSQWSANPRNPVEHGD